MTFQLEEFEHLVYSRQHEPAARMLVQLLGLLDSSYGVPGDQFRAQPLEALGADGIAPHVGVRLASAISCLFADRSFQFSPGGLPGLFTLQRWLAVLFGSTPFINADHVVRALNLSGRGDLEHLAVAPQDLARFCLLYMPESEIGLEIDAIWDVDPALAVSLGLALLSPRFLGAAVAHDKRETLLPWLSERLPLLDDLDKLPFGILHDVYMHCSYADRADKHAIKRSINVLIERWLDRHGLRALHAPRGIDPGTKPVLLVVLEWFNAGHSIYRTHSRTLEAARDRFHVIGMGLGSATDEPGRAVFDEFIEIHPVALAQQLGQIRDVAALRSAQILYMPSVGMFPLTMMLCNLRVAPVMAMALGHPATTHSEAMDVVVVEEDYVGDPACFSERLLILPRDGMPYRPSAHASAQPEAPRLRGRPEVVRICVAASAMKINPGFLDACRVIADTSNVAVHFHFAVAFARGMVHEQIRRVVAHTLGAHATVHSHRSYAAYMEIVRDCDMFINPFPFGNTNGVIDCVTAGLVGVCRTGPEVHEHIDHGLFDRLGLPGWLVAPDTERYIDAARRLAEDHDLRNDLRRNYSGPGKVQCLFQGRPEIMGRKFIELLEENPS